MIIINNEDGIDAYREILREQHLLSNYNKKVIENKIPKNTFKTYKNIHEKKIEKTQRKGEKFEFEVLENLSNEFNYINYLFCERNFIFNNGYNEIDFLIYSNDFIVLLEIKDYNCDIIINENDFIKKYDEKIYIEKDYYNPINRLENKSEYFKIILSKCKIPIYKFILINSKSLINNTKKDYILKDLNELNYKLNEIIILNKNTNEDTNKEHVISKIKKCKHIYTDINKKTN